MQNKFELRAALGVVAAAFASGCATVTYDEPESLAGLSDSGGSGATAMARGGSGGAAGVGGRAATGGTGSGLATGGSSSLVPAPTATMRPPPIPSMGAGGSTVAVDPGPPGEDLLVENFDDGVANGFAIPQDDGVILGTWAVVPVGAGFAYQQSDVSSSDESFAVGGDISWTNISLEAKVTFTAASNIEDATALLAVRFTTLDAYYFLAYRGDGTVKLRARANGSTPEFASADDNPLAAIGQTVTLKLVIKGTTLSAFLNNQLIAGPIENAELSVGGIALGSSENAAVQFDDVHVTVP